MAEAFSYETQILLEAADRAIARGKDIVDQRRQVVAECERANRQQEFRLIFLREIRKPK